MEVPTENKDNLQKVQLNLDIEGEVVNKEAVDDHKFDLENKFQISLTSGNYEIIHFPFIFVFPFLILEK